MGNGIFVNPIFLFPYHTSPAWDLSGGPSFMKRTRFGTIAKGLKSISLLARVPMIDSHLYRHSATPNTGTAFTVIDTGI
jgi:hypothetical protein